MASLVDVDGVSSLTDASHGGPGCEMWEDSLSPRSPSKNRASVSKSGSECKLGFRIQRPVESKLPAFWSARALSQHWRISRQQIYEAHKDGRLRGFRILGTLRFLEDDLLALLKREGIPVQAEESR